MDKTHEVVSVFLDDEPFNPEELAHALSDPAGRALLIDLIALRLAPGGGRYQIPKIPTVGGGQWSPPSV